MTTMPRLLRTASPAIAAGLVLITAGSAAAQITKNGPGYLLRAKYVAGTSARFRIDSSTSMGTGQAMKVVIPFSQKVKSLAKGVASIEYTVGPVNMNGAAQGKPQVINAQVDSRNRMVGGGPSGVNLGNVGFPEKPVRIGGSWTADVSGAAPGMTSKGTYTFKGVKSVGGKQVAEIAVKMTMGGNQGMSATGSGIMYLLVSDGSLHSGNLTQNMSMGSGANARAMTSTIKIVRL